MGYYVQVVVDVEGYQPENKTRIAEAVADVLDWHIVKLGERQGYLKYEGSLGYDDLDDQGEALAASVHSAIVGANDGIDVRTKSWFYDLETPFNTVELGEIEDTGAGRFLSR